MVFRCFVAVIALVRLIASSQPNILVFLADDLGYNDVAAFGSVDIETPTMDRLVKQGMRFTEFYSSAPLCTPSRAAFLTGRLPQRSGILTNYTYPRDDNYRVFLPTSVGGLPASEKTIPDLLKTKGYNSKIVGKWHLGHNKCLPTERGFDSFYGLPYSHEEGFPGPNPEDLVFPPVPLFRDTKIIEQPVNLTTLTDRYTKECVNYIETMSKSKTPFFLYMAYEEPHVPLFLNPRFKGKSRRGKYGDSVLQMDSSMGQIMAALEQFGVADNTLVIFFSDNGAWTHPTSGFSFTTKSITYPYDGGNNSPFRGGKGSTWEGGVRVPAFFWMPKVIPAAKTSMTTSSNMDLFSTILDFAGVSPPTDRTIDGVSLKPWLTNPNLKSNAHEFFYFWRETELMAIRYQNFKAHFITRPGFGLEPPIRHNPPLLYNLDWNVGEDIELNLTEYKDVLTTMENAATKHKQSFTIPAAQYNQNDWLLVPCCHHKLNMSEIIKFIEEGDISLALWDLCDCSKNP